MALTKEQIKNLKVGQTLCIAEIDYCSAQRLIAPKTCIIAKIGRKYFYTDSRVEQKFDIETGKHDAGGYSPRYELFIDEQTFLYVIELKDTWDTFRSIVNRLYNRPHYITIEKAKKLIELLQEPNTNE